MTNTNGVTRAYRRISLDTEKSGSIAKQTARLKAYETAKDRDPGAVVWYSDESVSGSKINFKDRPDGGRLWSDIAKGDRVVITKIDRAARNVRDLLNLVQHVTDRGATISFIDNDIDTSTSSGKLVLTILGAIAEFEASLISERRKDSLEAFAQEGRHAVGKAPYGFRSVPNPDGRGLVIAKHPEEAKKVHEAVMRVMAGESQNAVRESLGLSKTGFNRLLNNPRLAGMTPSGEGVVMVNGSPRINAEAQILSLAEWNALTEYLNKTDKAWSKREGFGRILRCEVCGDRLYLNINRAKPEHSGYRCRKTLPIHHVIDPETGKAPAGASIMAHVVEPRVAADFLKNYGRQPFTEVTWVDEDAAKVEAVSLAQVRVAEVQRRLSSAQDADEIRSLGAELVAAHESRAVAERLPSERVRKVIDTGETYADKWERSDTSDREAMVGDFGSYTVRVGRGLSKEDRMVWVPHHGAAGAPGVGLRDLTSMFSAKA